MAQYQDNANFSTDAAGTEVELDTSPDWSTNISNYTGAVKWIFGYYHNWTITTGGDHGGKYVAYTDTAAGYRGVILYQNGPGTTALTDELDITLRFRLPAMSSITYLQFFLNESNNSGYHLRIATDGDVSLWTNNGASEVTMVGSEIAKSITTNTWYWARIHRMSNSNNNEWSWAVYSGDFQTSPTWDVGDGGTGGIHNDDITAGVIGVGSLGPFSDIDFDWFSSADAGDSAPGPSAGAGTSTPQGLASLGRGINPQRSTRLGGELEG